MPHWITGLIGEVTQMRAIARKCQLECVAPLRHGFALVLLEHEDVERLAGPVSELGDEDEGIFDFMHPPWVELLCRLSAGLEFAYIETRYHGGSGGQGAAVFRNGHIVMEPTYSTGMESPISRALALLGVERGQGAIDEFDEVGLGDYRWSEWVREQLQRAKPD